MRINVKNIHCYWKISEMRNSEFDTQNYQLKWLAVYLFCNLKGIIFKIFTFANIERPDLDRKIY